MPDIAAMPESNFSPFSRSGLRRRIIADRGEPDHKRLTAINTLVPEFISSICTPGMPDLRYYTVAR